MSLPSITPHAARDLIAQGAILVDVREADEHARTRIPGARHAPLAGGLTGLPQEGVVVFHCRTGNRTSINAGKLASSTGCQAYVLEGGLDGWKAAGLPVLEDRKQPLELMRQVQITAGSLALLGAVLGFAINPTFHLLSGFIGAGLTFAGVTGWCGMAKVLAVLPWNRTLATATPVRD
ncbi:MAG: rhodanese family protein [Hyphomonadaceae bacterium]|jgi:rhodanese-related sulfurtransferase|nr:rhodanese family protein [Hyphomonadaceae bacterium]